MPRLTEEAHRLIRSTVRPGDVVIDATAGNGHDTRFLAELVGSKGRVFAFDTQPEAITATQSSVAEVGHVTLLLRDHAEMRDAIPVRFHGTVAAVMFNLGYLPDGDKSITTRAESTTRAITSALAILRRGGLVTVVAYTGHPGGEAEAEAVAEFVRGLPCESSVVETRCATRRKPAPRLFAIRKGDQNTNCNRVITVS